MQSWCFAHLEELEGVVYTSMILPCPWHSSHYHHQHLCLWLCLLSHFLLLHITHTTTVTLYTVAPSSTQHLVPLSHFLLLAACCLLHHVCTLVVMMGVVVLGGRSRSANNLMQHDIKINNLLAWSTTSSTSTTTATILSTPPHYTSFFSVAIIMGVAGVMVNSQHYRNTSSSSY